MQIAQTSSTRSRSAKHSHWCPRGVQYTCSIMKKIGCLHCKLYLLLVLWKQDFCYVLQSAALHPFLSVVDFPLLTLPQGICGSALHLKWFARYCLHLPKSPHALSIYSGCCQPLLLLMLVVASFSQDSKLEQAKQHFIDSQPTTTMCAISPRHRSI